MKPQSLFYNGALLEGVEEEINFSSRGLSAQNVEILPFSMLVFDKFCDFLVILHQSSFIQKNMAAGQSNHSHNNMSETQTQMLRNWPRIQK